MNQAFDEIRQFAASPGRFPQPFPHFMSLPEEAGALRKIAYKIEGAHSGWLDYAPGIEKGVTQPMLVFATAR